MPNYFTQQWVRDEYEFHRSHQGEAELCGSGSNLFVKRGVKRGDFLYVWAFFDWHLYLIGRMQVDRVVTYGEAVKIFGEGNVWDADWQAIAKEGTEIKMRFGLEVPLAVIRKLRLGPDKRPPVFRTRDKPDPQTFRGVRRLARASARELDRLLGIA